MTGLALSGRDFARVTAAGLLTGRLSLPAAGRLTAREVIERVKQHLGVPWNEKTYRDVFHAGDPDGTVHGMASTFMSNLDVLQRANAKVEFHHFSRAHILER